MQENARDHLLAVITVVLVVAALRASYPVTMPIAVAATIIAAIWPFKLSLDRVLSPRLGNLGVFLSLLVLLACLLGALYFSIAQAVAAFDANQDRFQEVYRSALAWAHRWGLPDPGGQEAYSRVVGVGRVFLANMYAILAYVGFIGLLIVFGLPEVTAKRARLREAMEREDRRALVTSVNEIAEKTRAYFRVTAMTSLLTGVACAAWALVLGLDLALVWGVLNFLLNYIPVIGNIVGIIPPSLFAFVQFHDWTMRAVTFGGFCVIQIVISNVVYPLVQGHALRLSPAAVLLSLTFWGWVWGIAGALIAVPLTVALVVACEQFSGTRWIAMLLSSKRQAGNSAS